MPAPPWGSIGAPLNLAGASGRKWSLTFERPLGPPPALPRTAAQASPAAQAPADTTVWAVRDRATGAVYAARRTHPAAPQVTLDDLLDDAAVWRAARVAAPHAPVVDLVDVAVDREARPAPEIIYLMQICARGHLPRAGKLPEDAVLGLVVDLVDAVQVVADAAAAAAGPNPPRPAHGNVSYDSVMLDAAGCARLGGFGPRRVAMLKDNPDLSVLDDCFDIGLLLYAVLFGKAPTKGPFAAFPDTKHAYSPRLLDILHLILAPGDDQSLDPPGPEILREMAVAAGGRAGLPIVAPLRSTAASDDASRHAESSMGQRQRPGALGQPDGIPVNMDHVERSVEKMMDGVDTAGAYSAILASTSSSNGLTCCDAIFAALFRCPISRDPIVAFRTCAMLHNLMLDGPEQVMDTIRRNERFMDWLENSWTRDAAREKSKPGDENAHASSFCFEGGEIAFFASFIRRKARFHMLAAGGYTGAWERTGVVNEQGKDVISMRRKKVVGGIADLVDMASELGASLASANDVETAVKHAGIRSLVDEVGRAHDAILVLAEECASVDSVVKFVSSYDRIWRAAKALIVAVRPLPVAGGGAWEQQLAGDSPRDIVAEVERRLEEEAMPDMAELDALEAAERKREEKEMKRIEREERRAQKAAQKEAAAVAAAAAAAAEEQALKEAAERALVVHEDAGASKLGTIFGDLLALDDSKRPAPDPSSADQRPTPGMSDAAALASAFGAPPEAVDGRFLALPAPEDGEAAHYGSDDDGYDGGYEHFRAQQAEEEARREKERRDISTGAWASRSGYGNMALVTAGPSLVPGKKHPVFCQCTMCAQAEAQQAAAIGAERAQDGYSDDGNPPAAAAFQPTTRRQQSLYDSEVEDDNAAGQHSGFGTKANGGDSHGDNGRGGYSDDDAGSYQSVTYSVGDGAEHGESISATGFKTPRQKIGDSCSIHVSSNSRPHSLLPTMLRGPPGNEKARPVLGLNMKRLRTGDKIGEGSFGIVYKGEYQGETVAIKKMHKQLIKSPEAVSEFIAEVNLMSDLKHPNLLRCVAASTVPPDIMLLTEYMKRGTLFDVLYRERIKLTWALIRKIALQAATGMCYLHAHRILHRDLKSSNLLVDGSYNVKLGDFGLAKPDIGVDPRGGISGTYQYMAPEILRGDSPSTLSDVYSFGVIVWEMVSGEPPYLGMDPLEAGRRVLEDDMRPIIPASCLRPYAAVIQACWATAPAARPSFAEVVGMIESTTK